jgi:hypothetical protein
MREWVGPMMKVGAILLLMVMVFARPLVNAVAGNWHPNDLVDDHAYVTLGLLLAVALGLLGSLATRSGVLAAAIVIAALAALLSVVLHAFGAPPDAAGVYPGVVAALVLALVGVTASTGANVKREPAEVGELVDGKRHGRWLVYGTDNVVAEIREYEYGKLLETRPYPPK